MGVGASLPGEIMGGRQILNQNIEADIKLKSVIRAFQALRSRFYCAVGLGVIKGRNTVVVTIFTPGQITWDWTIYDIGSTRNNHRYSVYPEWGRTSCRKWGNIEARVIKSNSPALLDVVESDLKSI